MAEPLNLELFRERLAVMQRLERSLVESETAILTMNAQQLESQAEEQRELCLEWQALDAKIHSQEPRLRSTKATTKGIGGDGQRLPALERFESLRQEMRRVEEELRQRTRVHAALLRRMRRSLVWLETLVRDPARTYSAPGGMR